MKGQFENEYGRVIIGSEVIATYAGSVAVECFGIVGMAAVNVIMIMQSFLYYIY